MDFSGINLAELIVAALSALLIGNIWYSDFLFGKKWRELSGVRGEKSYTSLMIKVHVSAFVLCFIIAAFLSIFSEIAMMLGTNALYAGLFSIVLCIGFVVTSFGINYMFGRKPLKLYLIDVGYMVASFFVMGLIIGAWH